MKLRLVVKAILLMIVILTLVACGGETAVNEVVDLSGKTFGVPRGTIADEWVLSVYPDARFVYYDSVFDAIPDLMSEKIDVVAYDEPILRSILAKTPGLKILDEMISVDHYGVAVQRDNQELADNINKVIAELKDSGLYNDMITRWLPKAGEPGPMPDITLEPINGVLRLGTSAVVEPFSYVGSCENIIGFDIELAKRVAQNMGMALEIVNMPFGDMIDAVRQGEVDMIAALITISDERSELVLFSTPYYVGGMAALVKE